MSDANDLAAANVPLLFWFVGRTSVPRYVSKGDVIGAGYLRMVQCAESFDETKGTFSNYFGKSWKRALMLLVNDHRSVGKYTHAVHNVFVRVKRAQKSDPLADVNAEIRKAFVHTYGRERVSAESHQRWDDVAYWAWRHGEQSLCEPAADSDGVPDAVMLVETIQSPNASVVDEINDAERVALARRVLAETQLTPRERDIIARRFWSDPQETLKDIGDGYGISRERARQIEEAALSKLRKTALRIASEEFSA